jgi:hypothetical protein
MDQLALPIRLTLSRLAFALVSTLWALALRFAWYPIAAAPGIGRALIAGR